MNAIRFYPTIKNLFQYLLFLLLSVAVVFPSTASAKKDRCPYRKEVFLEKIKAYRQDESWAHKAIFKDLSNFSNKDLSPETLETLFRNELGHPGRLICLIRIKNNIPTILTSQNRTPNGREKAVLQTLECMCQTSPLPNVTFLISSHDRFTTYEFPVCTFSKIEDSLGICMPDFEALSGYSKLRDQIEKAISRHPWNSKIEQVFWRGSTTGAHYTTDNCLELPRSQAVLYSLAHPECLDARFTTVTQNSPGVIELLNGKNMLGKPLPASASLKYKYLLDIDGNASTFSRSFWILSSNSVLLKMTSVNIQWYHDLLSENQNYVRIGSDLSDLQEKLDWLKSNDKHAHRIANQATSLAKNHLSHEAALAYFFCLIEEISKLQGYHIK